jgi:hypothetical protein
MSLLLLFHGAATGEPEPEPEPEPEAPSGFRGGTYLRPFRGTMRAKRRKREDEFWWWE